MGLSPDTGQLVAATHLVLVLNLQHGSGAAQVLHQGLCLLQQLIAVYRPLQAHTQREMFTTRTKNNNSNDYNIDVSKVSMQCYT